MSSDGARPPEDPRTGAPCQNQNFNQFQMDIQDPGPGSTPFLPAERGQMGGKEQPGKRLQTEPEPLLSWTRTPLLVLVVPVLPVLPVLLVLLVLIFVILLIQFRWNRVYMKL